MDQGEPTTATDVYALGVLLHELLTGGLHPTAGADQATPLAQLQALVKTTPRRPSEAVAHQGGAQAKKLTRVLQGDLDTIIGRALKNSRPSVTATPPSWPTTCGITCSTSPSPRGPTARCTGWPNSCAATRGAWPPPAA